MCLCTWQFSNSSTNIYGLAQSPPSGPAIPVRARPTEKVVKFLQKVVKKWSNPPDTNPRDHVNVLPGDHTMFVFLLLRCSSFVETELATQLDYSKANVEYVSGFGFRVSDSPSGTAGLTCAAAHGLTATLHLTVTAGSQRGTGAATLSYDAPFIPSGENVTSGENEKGAIPTAGNYTVTLGGGRFGLYDATQAGRVGVTGAEASVRLLEP